jgi:cyclophilin family peptidyl-prolyl cis-trans isomerase
VIEGMNVVDDIGHRATTTRNGMSEVPEEPVVIRRISLMDATRQK